MAKRKAAIRRGNAPNGEPKSVKALARITVIPLADGRVRVENKGVVLDAVPVLLRRGAIAYEKMIMEREQQ